METGPTIDEQLLAETKKSREALESLRTIAVIWSFVAVLFGVIWLIATIAGG